MVDDEPNAESKAVGGRPLRHWNRGVLAARDSEKKMAEYPDVPNKPTDINVSQVASFKQGR